MLGQEGAGSGSAGPMAPLSSPRRWSSERRGAVERRWRSGRRGHEVEERSGAAAAPGGSHGSLRGTTGRGGTVREEQREEGRKEKAERDGSLLARARNEAASAGEVPEPGSTGTSNAGGGRSTRRRAPVHGNRRERGLRERNQRKEKKGERGARDEVGLDQWRLTGRSCWRCCSSPAGTAGSICLGIEAGGAGLVRHRNRGGGWRWIWVMGWSVGVAAREDP